VQLSVDFARELPEHRLGGLTFGSVLFQEKDLSDKVDDGGFLVIAALAVGWYLWSSNRFKRSPVPILLGALALVVQVLGLVLERDDPKAFGDNIGGMFFFALAIGLIAFQYRRTSVQGSSLAGRPTCVRRWSGWAGRLHATATSPSPPSPSPRS
jgi:hypothetical protein